MRRPIANDGPIALNEEQVSTSSVTVEPTDRFHSLHHFVLSSLSSVYSSSCIYNCFLLTTTYAAFQIICNHFPFLVRHLPPSSRRGLYLTIRDHIYIYLGARSNVLLACLSDSFIICTIPKYRTCTNRAKHMYMLQKILHPLLGPVVLRYRQYFDGVCLLSIKSKLEEPDIKEVSFAGPQIAPQW